MAKAFLVKTLAETDTKPTRLKVCFEQCKSITYSRDSFNPNCESQSVYQQAIERFCLDSWITVKPVIVGQLPNGDYCGVFKGK